MTTLSPRTACAAGLLSLGALLLSGCASSGSTSSSSASSQASASSTGGRGGAAMAAYRQCLSQHGVTMPSGRPTARPSGGGGGYGGGNGGGGFGFGGGASANPTMAAAMQACASLRPKFGGGGKGGRGGFNSTAMAAFTSCMKDHGVTLPATGGVRALNTADPKTSAAFNICKVLIPTRSPGAAPSASPSA
ncbi:hypothetical protein [Streptacidiphilus fuscans]|uniref:Lipoprotein n=1 Tax=Streptacidiphilus fuscans TaxID=2789292 RepID=A0A931B7G3_9ACTN|nr:hypothetical protein [Streptacidiphilus fuscans]MBF9070867.1 hypothetical protein [Streptacidiphilus fuscans]